MRNLSVTDRASLVAAKKNLEHFLTPKSESEDKVKQLAIETIKKFEPKYLERYEAKQLKKMRKKSAKKVTEEEAAMSSLDRQISELKKIKSVSNSFAFSLFSDYRKGDTAKERALMCFYTLLAMDLAALISDSGNNEAVNLALHRLHESMHYARKIKTE